MSDMGFTVERRHRKAPGFEHHAYTSQAIDFTYGSADLVRARIDPPHHKVLYSVSCNPPLGAATLLELQDISAAP